MKSQKLLCAVCKNKHPLTNFSLNAIIKKRKNMSTQEEKTNKKQEYNLQQLYKIRDELRESLIQKDERFVTQLDEIMFGKSWKVDPYVKYIDQKYKQVLSREQTDYLFCLYEIEKLEQGRLEDSNILAVLILCYERFSKYVIRKLTILPHIDFEDLMGELRLYLQTAIESYDFMQEAKFTTYAGNVIWCLAVRYLRTKNDYSLSFDDFAYPNETSNSGLKLADVIGEDDEYLEQYANKDEYGDIWKLLGYFKPSVQFCLIAYSGKYLKPMTQIEMAKLFHKSKQYISFILDSALEELKVMTQNPNYINRRGWTTFHKLTGKTSQVRLPYHLLSKEEFLDILQNGLDRERAMKL